MYKRSAGILMLTPIVLFGGCRGGPRARFSPPLVAENDVLKMEVREVKQRGRNTHVWLTLTNKTDDTLDLSYRDITGAVGEQTAPGGLKMAVVRSEKPFEMPPHFVKRISAPVEFRDLPPMETLEVTVTNIQVRGKDRAPDVGIDVPVRKPRPPADKQN